MTVSYGAPIAESARQADRRAERLLASAAGEEALTMFRRLGFLHFEGDGYGYLIYPHRPLLAYDSASGEPLSEFCVKFLESNERLPDADDVLAKWMALEADEKLVVGEANIDRVGVQLDPEQVRRDLRTLRLWQCTAASSWRETA
ncbi:MAG: hypothetical protein ACXWW8_01405 [Solirubrobacterales bacterium]